MAKIYDGSPDKVREICRHLKPMLGDKADQLFHAYLAEDDPGRQQIETYLELLQTKYLLAGLDDNSQVSSTETLRQEHSDSEKKNGSSMSEYSAGQEQERQTSAFRS